MKTVIVILTIFCGSVSFGQQKFDVFFDFNKEDVNASSRETMVSWMNNNIDATIIGLSGYADSVDASSYNKELSMRRIRSVVAVLNAANMKLADHLMLRPVGEDFEIDKDQARNRRVTILYQPKGEVRSTLAIVENDSIHENLAELFANRRPGDLVRIRNIHFYRNKEQVIAESEPLFQQLYEVMTANPRLSIEIHGHICCNPNIYDTALSYRRAKYIFTYLLQKGIALNRLAYMGFGSSEPIYAIPEKSHEEQIANRRVEILIIRN